MYDASIVFTGILSRVTMNVSTSFIPRLTIPSLTSVPRLPLRRFIISSRSIFTPAIVVSLTLTMRSPASIPTFSDGPFVTGCIISSVSSTMLNCTPMPSNEPCSDSCIDFVSFAVVYDECGSSSFSMPLMPSSTSFCSFTLSTYRFDIAISAICSLRIGLLSPKLSLICAFAFAAVHRHKNAAMVAAFDIMFIVSVMSFLFHRWCQCPAVFSLSVSLAYCISSGKSSSTTRLSMMKFWRSMVFFPI